jgi:alpha-glucuronidase
VLDFDTAATGDGLPVKRLLGGITGVSNIGSARNWTGHHLAQANLYGYGRLAWDPDLRPQQIAEEWAAMTFGCPDELLLFFHRVPYTHKLHVKHVFKKLHVKDRTQAALWALQNSTTGAASQ